MLGTMKAFLGGPLVPRSEPIMTHNFKTSLLRSQIRETLLIYSFIGYLLNTHYVSETVPITRGTDMDMRERSS